MRTVGSSGLAFLLLTVACARGDTGAAGQDGGDAGLALARYI